MRSSLKQNLGLQANSQVIIIFVLAIGGIFALILGNTVGVGEYKNAYLMVLLLVGLFLIFKLQSSFWIFIPFAMVSDLPTIPLGGVSLDLGQLWILGSILCVLIYWPMYGKTLKLNVGRLWPIYLYTLIAFITYMQNPVGFGSFGSDTGGMRYYVIIGLAFLALLILSNYEINERTARHIATLLIIGVMVEFSWKFLQFYLPQLSAFTGRSAGSEDGGGFYGSSQLFAIVPIIVLPLIFGRFRLGQLLTPQRMWLLVVIALCYVALVLSGKRSLAVIALAYPAMSEFFRGKWAVSAIIGAMAAIAVSVMLFLHSTGVELPKTAQRVLSVFPGEWDRDAQASADNSFRDTLNRIAGERIRENLWVGRGFKADFELIYMLQESPGQVLLPGEHYGGAIHSTTSNWHNTWMGITADFGLAATIFWACAWIVLLRRGFRLRKIIFRKYGDSNWTSGLVLAILMWTCLDIIRSWQFGHSALNLWTISWRYGILLGLENYVLRAEAVSDESPQPAAESGTPMFEPAMARKSL